MNNTGLLQSALASRVPQNPPAITSIEPSQDAIAGQSIANLGKTSSVPGGAGGMVTGMTGIGDSYGSINDTGKASSANALDNNPGAVSPNALNSSIGYGDNTIGNYASNAIQSSQYVGGGANTPEWVQQTAIANQVLNLAGMASKAYYGADSAVTQGLGYGSTATGGLLTAYSAYKAVTGNADEKKQAYQGLGQQAVNIGLKQAAAYGAGEAAAAAGGSVGTSAVGTGVYGAGGVYGGTALGSTIGSTLGSIAGGFATAMPYYALAKTGGAIINATVANNPQLAETPYGRLGRGLDEPLAVEQDLANQAAEHGIGNKEMNEAAATANPLEVGGWIEDTTDKTLTTVTGGVYGANQIYDAGSNDVKNAADSLGGGLPFLVNRIFGGGK